MDIIHNKLGQERVLTQIDFQHIRVMGESMLTRKGYADGGKVTFVEFENGPRYSANSTFTFKNLEWKVLDIKLLDTPYENFTECVLKVAPVY